VNTLSDFKKYIDALTSINKLNQNGALTVGSLVDAIKGLNQAQIDDIALKNKDLFSM
jgi:hypothetical protein